MTRGTKTIVLFTEDCYHNSAPCGFYIEGRPKLQQIKMRNHRKFCDVCRFLDEDTLKHIYTKEFFTSKAPMKRVKGVIAGNNKGRSIDRNIGLCGQNEVISEFDMLSDKFIFDKSDKLAKQYEELLKQRNIESESLLIKELIKDRIRRKRSRDKKKRQKARRKE